jgi:imipenem/basic amino acid-specific outer membrane pore
MRGTVSLSLLASALVVNAMAADSLESMFKEGKASGQIRYFYVDREYQGTAETRLIEMLWQLVVI